MGGNKKITGKTRTNRMKLKNIKYPSYYNVDDVPVVLELEGDEVVGKIVNGKPFPVGKAIVEGYRITKDEYFRLAEDLH